MFNIVDAGNYNRGMPGRMVRYEQDYVTFAFPHKIVRRILWSYVRSYWLPHTFKCDCTIPTSGGIIHRSTRIHSHFTWFMLAKHVWRLLIHGYTEDRWD